MELDLTFHHTGLWELIWHPELSYAKPFIGALATSGVYVEEVDFEIL